MKELLEEMIHVPGVSGFEDEIREFIRSKVEAMGLKTEEDNIGNLICTIGDTGPKVVLIAHMDELGLIVSKLENDGSIRIRKIGGIDDRTLVGRVVEIKTEKGTVNGVIGLKPPHLMTESDDKKKAVSWEDVRVDVGTRSRKETEKLGIRILDPMVFKKDVSYIGRDLICARGIDNRAGCAILLDAIDILRKRKLPVKLVFVWSVQEEIGLKGAKVVGFSMRPDYVFAVDTMTTTDGPMQGDAYERILLGSGPALRMLDHAAIASPRLRKMIEAVAKEKKIPLQYGTGGGATDGAVMQDFGALMMPLGIPMRYTHSPTECASLKDLQNLSRLIVAISERIAGKKTR
ncbi:MAG: M42 family metallopeptidase [Candidatus Thermoplasmatota archaeon]|nr:M42 family metallopeptidase [Candidatus Thermoplasmatota archaeon]